MGVVVGSRRIIGRRRRFPPGGMRRKRYFDQTARVFGPIEDLIRDEVLPYMANTHTEASFTGCYMTTLYREAHERAALNAERTTPSCSRGPAPRGPSTS